MSSTGDMERDVTLVTGEKKKKNENTTFISIEGIKSNYKTMTDGNKSTPHLLLCPGK